MVAGEKLSCLFDGDAADSEVEELLEQIHADDDHRERWTVFTMLSDVLVGVASPDDGYSQRIIARLRDSEPEPGFDPLEPPG